MTLHSRIFPPGRQKKITINFITILRIPFQLQISAVHQLPRFKESRGLKIISLIIEEKTVNSHSSLGNTTWRHESRFHRIKDIEQKSLEEHPVSLERSRCISSGRTTVISLRSAACSQVKFFRVRRRIIEVQRRLLLGFRIRELSLSGANRKLDAQGGCTTGL